MSIDPDVIRDLLPLYRSGLASPATVKLIEAELGSERDRSLPAEPADDAGHLAWFERARTLARWRRWLLAIAAGLTALLFTTTFTFRSGHFASARLEALEHPASFAPVAFAAIIAWAGYAWVRRRIN